MSKKISSPVEAGVGSVPTIYPMPLVRVDLVLLGVKGGALHVLLSRRKEAPYAGRMGLPGGVLRIDLDASLEAAAQRVAHERLSNELPNLCQVGAVGAANRDPRAPWAMSVIYRSLVQPDLAVTPGKRVDALVWTLADEVIKAKNLAFDHADLVARALEASRLDVANLRYPKGWVTEPFTVPDLQALSEAVLGRTLDKVTFRRRIHAEGVADAQEGQLRSSGAHRPSQLYCLR
jgi:8-oxo-dGTP diphosphatase